MMKPDLIDPHVVAWKSQSTRKCGLVQEPGKFVKTETGAYHYDFDGGYNVAETTIFANASELEVSRGAAAVSSDSRMSYSVSLPCEFNAWEVILRLLLVASLGNLLTATQCQDAATVLALLPFYFGSHVQRCISVSATKGSSS